MKKKILYLALILVVIVSLAACGSKDSAPAETNTGTTPSETSSGTAPADDESSTSGDTDNTGAETAASGDITGEWKFSKEYMDLFEMAQQFQTNTDSELNIMLARDTRLTINSDKTYHIITGDGKTYEEGTYTLDSDNVLVLINGSDGGETINYFKNGSIFEENGVDPYWVRSN